MAIINYRWPRELCPESCTFRRTRNDFAQVSPRSKKTSVIRQGRPLWSAEVSWSFPNNAKLARLRYLLDALDGFSGSVQIWDFASPYPFGTALSQSSSANGALQWVHSEALYPWVFQGVPEFWSLDAFLEATDAGTIGDTSLAISGLEADSLVALQGQYLQIGRRLHLVADTVTANGAGEASIPLTTPLVSNVLTGETIRFVEAACEMRLADQNFNANGRAGSGFVSYTAKFIETVEDYV